MGTGFRGAFVISWSQTEVDGLMAAPVASLVTGAVWSWQGETLRVDGPSDVLQLDQAEGAEERRDRAARAVKRLVGAAFAPAMAGHTQVQDHGPLLHTGFVVTDGEALFDVTVIPTGRERPPLLLFVNDIPPARTDLWVVQSHLDTPDLQDDAAHEPEAGVICFTPGTQIDTPAGPRLIEDLREGDFVQTRDNGPQEILWYGSRRMTGARLFVMPRLRPIRIRGAALSPDRPREDLVVSPDHQILIDGPAAYDLFNEREVLVAARHLVNDSTIIVDRARRHVTYIHLLLPQHEVLTANGVACESFHPANADLDTLSPEDLRRLMERFPDLSIDPHRYGAEARRTLTASEGALVGHVA